MSPFHHLSPKSAFSHVVGSSDIASLETGPIIALDQVALMPIVRDDPHTSNELSFSQHFRIWFTFYTVGEILG